MTKAAAAHPRWLEPEIAQLLDNNGFRRDVARDIYIAPNGFRVTESQLLVHDVESLQRLIMGKAKAATEPEPPTPTPVLPAPIRRRRRG